MFKAIEVFKDLLILAGIFCFAFGLYQIYPPLAYIFIGLSFILSGFGGAK